MIEGVLATALGGIADTATIGIAIVLWRLDRRVLKVEWHLDQEG